MLGVVRCSVRCIDQCLVLGAWLCSARCGAVFECSVLCGTVFGARCSVVHGVRCSAVLGAVL